jgi:hypothetical protein
MTSFLGTPVAIQRSSGFDLLGFGVARVFDDLDGLVDTDSQLALARVPDSLALPIPGSGPTFHADLVESLVVALTGSGRSLLSLLAEGAW